MAGGIQLPQPGNGAKVPFPVGGSNPLAVPLTSNPLSTPLANNPLAGGAIGGSSPDLLRGLLDPSIGATGTHNAQSGNQDFLSWLTDILSRPMRVVANPIHQGLSEVQKAEKEGPGKYDVAGGLANVLTAPFRGLVSTNPDDQPDWSHNVEQIADTAGKLKDPTGYKDTPDNVNPNLKGALGLVGDIALDPTTYIGAGWVKALPKVADEGIAAAETAAKGGKDVAEAADAAQGTKLVDTQAPNSNPLAPTTPLNDATTKLIQNGMAKGPTGLNPVQNPAAYVPSKILATLDAPKQTASVLKELQSAPVVKAATDPTVPLGKARWMREFAKAQPDAQLTPVLKAGDLLGDPGLARLPHNADALNQVYEQYSKAFVQAQGRGKYLRPDGKLVAPPKPGKQVPLNTLQQHSAMARFAQLRSTDDGAARLDAAFGPNITNRLQRTTNPKLFDEKVTHLNNILDRTTDIDTIKSNAELPPIQRELMKHFGIDIGTTNQLRTVNRLADPSRVAATVAAKDVAPETIPAARVLTPVEQEVVNKVPEVWRKQFVERYPYKTATGVERTSPVKGEGLGKRSGIFNQFSQMNLRKALSDDVFKAAQDFKGSPKARAELVQAETMKRLGMSDELAKHFGVPLYLGVSNLDALPLSLHQAYTLLDHADHNAVLKMLWNRKTAVPDTNIADAINTLYRGGTHDEAVQALMNNARRNLGQDGKPITFANNLVDNPSDLTYGHYANLGKGAPKAPAGARLVANGTKGWFVKYDPAHLAEQYANTIEKAMPDIKRAVEMNSADYATRLTTETNELTAASMGKIEALVNDPDSFADALRAIHNIPEDVQAEANAAHATQDAVDMATSNVEGHIDPWVQAGADAGVKNEKLFSSAFGNIDKWREVENAAKKNTNKFVKVTGDEMSAMAKLSAAAEAESGDTAAQAEQLLTKLMPEVDVSNDVATRVETGIHGLFDPARKLFDVRFGNANVFDVLHGYGVLADLRRTRVGRQLGKLARDYSRPYEGSSTTVLQLAYRNWQRGITSEDPILNQAVSDIDRVWGNQWRGKGALLNNDFFRNGASLKAVEDAMREVGLDTEKYSIDAEKLFEEAARNGTHPIDEAMKQVAQWEIDDPVDFMHKMYAAAEKVTTRATIAGSFVDHFGKLGLISKTPKAGFSRIVASGTNTYTRYLPDDIFVADDLAHEWAVFDRISSMSRTPDGELGRAVVKYFDPLQRAWKYAITLPRPGHHIRNLIGDWSMTFVARGTRYMNRSTNDAFKIMSMAKQYEGVDLNRVLANDITREMPKGSDLISKGRYGKITVQDAVEAAMRHGMFPSFSTLEDLIGVEQKSGFQQAVDKVFLRGGKIERSLGTVSEARDHLSRLQHFMQAVHQMQKDGVKGAKTLDDLYVAAAREVRKYHPDGSSLTPFEAKYMRRIIPFYTWFRGVLPTIITSTMLHPGRVLVFPKTSYNLAVAMGVHPDSMSNPFPPDQMFPSFLTDQATGPQFRMADGRYLGFSPGIAHFDVANTLTNPIRGVAGMVSPIIRMPAELIGNSQWGTGTQIKSVPDYLDQNLPGVNYVANVSGYSPTGTLANVLSGKFQAAPQSGTTPNKKGVTNKDLTDKAISGFNWATGLGALDMSKPNYVSYAEIEKRNAARNAATGG